MANLRTHAFPTDRPCDDCGSTEAVWHYPDPEGYGVHACNLCAVCAGKP